MIKTEKYKKLIESKFDYDYNIVRFMTMNEILNYLKIGKDQANIVGRTIRILKIEYKIGRINNKVHRIYRMRRKNDYSISNRIFHNQYELTELVKSIFEKDSNNYLTQNQIYEIIKEIRPTFSESKKMIGMVLLKMGFKTLQKRINNKNFRVYYLKRAAQHSDELEDLFGIG